VYLGLKKHRQIRSPLITIFYRDGIVFFLALAGERDLFQVLIMRKSHRIQPLLL
jgi:hypothetical protein